METFTIGELSGRASELVHTVEAGHLALVTNNGQPFGIVVPFEEKLLSEGVSITLAIDLFREGKVGLSQAGKIAGISSSEMMDILSAHQIPLADYSKDELSNELNQFL